MTCCLCVPSLLLDNLVASQHLEPLKQRWADCGCRMDQPWGQRQGQEAGTFLWRLWGARSLFSDARKGNLSSPAGISGMMSVSPEVSQQTGQAPNLDSHPVSPLFLWWLSCPSWEDWGLKCLYRSSFPQNSLRMGSAGLQAPSMGTLRTGTVSYMHSAVLTQSPYAQPWYSSSHTPSPLG